MVDKLKEIKAKIDIGMNRREVKAALGEPTDVSVTKARQQPNIYKYGDVELFFTDGWHGRLWRIYAEDENHDEIIV